MKQSFLPLLAFTLSLFFSCNNKKDDPTPNQPTNNNPTVITNTAPLLEPNLSYTTTTETLLTIDLSSKISDSENDTWSIITATVNHGSTTISGTTINYTSNTSYSGNDTITLSIKDSKGATSIGKIAITVNTSSTSTNHVPSVDNSNKITIEAEQILGNTYGYIIYIKTFNRNPSFNVVDADNDNVAITQIQGASSNITIQGIASNATADDIINGNGVSGNLTIIPYSRIYSGVETLNITFSDGKSSVTKTFTVQLGSDAKLQATNILLNFMNRPLNFVTGSNNASFYGTLKLNIDASLVTTGTQVGGGFFQYVISPGTYSYSIDRAGVLVISITANNTTITHTYWIQTYYNDSSILQLTKTDTQTLYLFN